MENQTSNIEKITSEESCKMAQTLVNMYMSRSRTIDNNGSVVEQNTYTSEEREEQSEMIVKLLTPDMNLTKASLAERLLGYESTVQRTVTTTDENGDPKTITYEACVSSFTGEARYELTHALNAFRVAQAMELLNNQQ